MNIEAEHAAYGGHDSLLTAQDLNRGQQQWSSLFAAAGLNLVHTVPALRDHLIECRQRWEQRVAASEVSEQVAEEMFLEQVRLAYVVAFAMQAAFWS